MGERLQRLPKWARIVLALVTIVGPVTGAISTATVAIINVRARVRSTNQKTEAGYKTLAPAIKQLQDIVKTGQTDADQLAAEISGLEVDNDELKERVIRLEAYVDLLSKQRNLPAAPAPAVSYARPLKEIAKTLKPKKKVQEPSRPIPQDVGGAKAYQQQRVQKMCLPDDPLCGATK